MCRNAYTFLKNLNYLHVLTFHITLQRRRKRSDIWIEDVFIELSIIGMNSEGEELG
jgi:hypothetical protein